MQDTQENIVQAMFHASISIELGDGTRSFFWTDRWLHGKSIKDLAPCLCNVVGLRIQRKRTVAEGLQEDLWIRDITGALTVQVLLDYLLIWDLTRNIILHPEIPDRLIWKWTGDHTFSTASAYRAFFIGQYSIPGATILKKTQAPGKCKFFGWLVLHDRCWTAARRKRHNLQDDDSCALCCQASETITHLLVSCPFSKECWYAILQTLHWQPLFPDRDPFSLAEWWSGARKRLPKTDRRCFDSTVILISWILWMERNKRIFDHRSRSVQQLLCSIADEAVLWTLAGYKQVEHLAVALGCLPGRESLAIL